jgi:hypothetical protein
MIANKNRRFSNGFVVTFASATLVFSKKIQEVAPWPNPPPGLIRSLASYLLFFPLVLATAAVPANAGPSLGMQTDIVSEKLESGNFPLLAAKKCAPITLDQSDWPGVLRAAADLQSDVERVTGLKPLLFTNGAPAESSPSSLGR